MNRFQKLTTFQKICLVIGVSSGIGAIFLIKYEQERIQNLRSLNQTYSEAI